MTNTDTKPKYLDTKVPAVGFPLVTKADVLKQSHPVNYSGYSGHKKAGSAIIVKDGANYNIAVALGSEPKSPWQVVTGTAAKLTPAGDSIASKGNQFSDAKPKLTENLEGSVDLPTASKTDLLNVNSAVNSVYAGGKRYGACILSMDAGTPTFLLAAGSTPTDKWGGANGTAVLTPTGTLAVQKSDFKYGDHKPKIKDSVVTAIPFPVFAEADFKDVDSSLNKGDGITSGKREGALAISYKAATAPVLYVAAGDKPADKWVILGGGAAITPA